jgi:large subunit ribosomal protein L28
MAKYCEVCGKGVMSGNRISHSHRKSRRIWAPNVQRVRVVENGTPKRKYVCTRCLRSGKVERYAN